LTGSRISGREVIESVRRIVKKDEGKTIVGIVVIAITAHEKTSALTGTPRDPHSSGSQSLFWAVLPPGGAVPLCLLRVVSVGGEKR
jgi:hypothetical protein